MGRVSRAHILVLLEPQGCFYGSPMSGKCQSGSQESVWNGCTLKPVSNTPESAYVAVSSAGVKMQDGRKERRKEKEVKLYIYKDRCRVGFQSVAQALSHRVG